MDTTLTTPYSTMAEALGILDMPVEMQETIIDQAGEIIFQAVMVRSADTLTEADQKKVEQMLDEGKSFEDIIEFLEEHIPDFANIVTQEGSKIKQALATA